MSPGIDHSDTQGKNTFDDDNAEQNASTNTNTNGTNNTTSTTDEWYDVKKLDGIRKLAGKWEYRVLREDGTRTWQPEENITDSAKQAYHEHYTLAGRKRRKPRQ